jgi:nucleoside-diphosphate-sugar epimerase
MSKRVVITGASGNVGTALLRKLAVETDYEVHRIPATGSLQVPVLHADDVADACVRAIQRCATRAFNLSAEPPLEPQHVVKALGPMPMPVPTFIHPPSSSRRPPRAAAR